MVLVKRTSNAIDLNLNSIHNINIFYGVELLFKMMCFGVYFEQHAFFRNPLNIYDTIIVLHDLSCYIFTLKNEIWLFPLRLISIVMKIKLWELQKILQSIFLSLKLTGEVFFIVLLFCFMYSLFGLYLFSGLFKKICFDPFSGFKNSADIVCGNVECPLGFVCGKLISSTYEVSNFDNLLFSFMSILRILTLDDWNSLQNLCQKTYTNYIWIYFFSFIFFGNFFLINILLAVQKISYSKMMAHTAELKISLKNKEIEYNFKEFRMKEIDEENNITGLIIEKPKRLESINRSSFNEKKNNRLAKITPAKSSKEITMKGSGKIVAFQKDNQKNHELPLPSSEYSKPSTKFNEPSSCNKENENKVKIVKTKSKNNNRMTLRKICKYCICIKKISEKLIFAIVAMFLLENEKHSSKNFAIVVLSEKKYYGLSVDDVLPEKYDINNIIYCF